MKLKKFALRGLIALAVMVAVCMFFARTVQSITTPKVQVITAEKGRFEEKLSYAAQVHFTGTETISIANPYGMEVAQIHVQPGDHVQAGDTIFTLTLPGYAEQKKALQAEYSVLSTQLMELDAANYTLPKSAPQSNLYSDMAAASAALHEAVYAAQLAALQNGISLPANVSAWGEVTAPAAVSHKVEQAIAAYAAYDAACSAFNSYITANPGSEAVFTYVKARNALLADMEPLIAQMLALDMAMAQPNMVTASHAGYIVSVDAASLSYSISTEGCEPILRCLAPGRSIADGTRADVVSDTFGTERSSVMETVGNYLHVPIPEDMQKAGAVRHFMGSDVPISITYRAKQATTLLPVSALRGSGDETYVYQIEYVYGGILSTRSMKVVKIPVTIIERNSQTVSIAEDLEGKEIAVREDRVLTDGQTVMHYVN